MRLCFLCRPLHAQCWWQTNEPAAWRDTYFLWCSCARKYKRFQNTEKALQEGWVKSSVLYGRLWREFTSVREAVKRVQFCTGGCEESSVLYGRLWREFSSVREAVKRVQFCTGGCEESSVLYGRLWREFNSVREAVKRVQFCTGGCEESSVLYGRLWREFSSVREGWVKSLILYGRLWRKGLVARVRIWSEDFMCNILSV
jgi:hypothetical protein